MTRLARVLAAATAAAVLWTLRPGLPQLPPSLTTPVTVGEVEEVLVFLAWLALVVALLVAAGRHSVEANSRDVAHQRHGAVVSPRAPTSRRGAPLSVAPALTVVAPPTEDETTRAGWPTDPVTTRNVAARVEGSMQRPARRIRLVGPFSIDGIPSDARAVRSSTEQLIAYLALRPQGATRDELTEAIWPGEDPRRTRQRLWQSTSEARKLMGDAFVSQRGHYSLDRTKIAVDADELTALLAEAKAATTPTAERRTLERDLGLLRGEPLTGWDHVWADTDAARLRATQAELLERLGRARLATDDAHGALQAAEQGLDRDALNEVLWRLAMRAELQLGLREAVDRRYERLRTLLDEQLGLEPEAETRALYRKLMSQH